MSNSSAPGDWHDALLDLLTARASIPEDRARRYLDRHAEEVRSTAQRLAPVSDDHPCAHCGHPKRAHLENPVWCRQCPPSTSSTGVPGWHVYAPAEAQR